MLSTIQRFFQVLSEIVPNYKEYLNPPCDPALFTEIENLIGEELPPAFKEFYSIADGEIQDTRLGLTFFRLMSLFEILEEHKKVLQCLDSKNYDNTGYPITKSYNGNRVKSLLFHHKKRLLISCLDVDLFSLDFDPANEGTKGQVILHNHTGDGMFDVCYDYASDFEAFIQLLTNLMIENKRECQNDQSLYGKVDIEKTAKNSCILPIDGIQKEKFDNLPSDWKEYFRNIFYKLERKLVDSLWKMVYYHDEVTLEKLSEICELRLSPITEEQLQNNRFKGVLPKNQGVVMEDTYKHLLQDITPLILMPRLKELRFWYEINLSQLDFVSKYLTQIYEMSVPNFFQQEDLKIIGKFKRLFELHLNCGKIDDFSDLLSCKDLARLTLNSNENLNLLALSELKELRMLDIIRSGNIEDFSALSAFKGRLNLQMTREQFLKAHMYMNKNNIKPTLIVPYGIVEAPITEEQQTIINKWFDK